MNGPLDAALSLAAAPADGALWPILVLPLLGALVNGLAGARLQARLGRRVVAAVAVGVMVLAAGFALQAVGRLLALPPGGRLLVDHGWTLLAIDLAELGLGRFQVDFALALDPLAAVLVLVITLVGTLIHVYSIGYMAEEESAWRFFAYLNLFVAAMLLLVLADSLLLCFFGWEGVGLCSYLLIGFWYRELDNARAARKAFLVNRVGDWGFLVGLLLIFWGAAGAFAPERPAWTRSGGEGASPAADRAGTAAPLAARSATATTPTLTFRTLERQLAPEDPGGLRRRLAEAEIAGLPLLLMAGLALFLGMAGKSAQIPLYTWLPDAMAGPTPVSALIHAATMVTAGVYLATRLAFLFALSPAVLAVLAVAGLLTALLGAVLALVQQDIKKVLAYSTISQLGFMFLALGAGAHGAAVFHLVTHACFKACLFLAAGSVIHALHPALAGPGQARDEGEAEGAAAASGASPARDARLTPEPTDPQDLRNMGGLARVLPHTRLAFLLGALAIAGFPIAAGFYSKDEILWRVFSSPVLSATLPVPAAALYAVALLTAGLTAFYVFRCYYLVFYASPSPPPGPAALTAHEAPVSMRAPLLILAGVSVVAGALLGWPEAWGGHPLLEQFLAPVLRPAWRDLFASGRPDPALGSGPLALQALGVAVALAGWALARALYRDLARTRARLEAWRARWDLVHRALWHRLRVDELYRELFVHPVEDFARAAAWTDRRLVDAAVGALARLARLVAGLGGAFDRYLVDGIVNGVAAATLAGGRRLQRLQTGRINHYVLGIAVGSGLLVVLAWVLR